jgi:hypothetical protein
MIVHWEKEEHVDLEAAQDEARTYLRCRFEANQGSD